MRHYSLSRKDSKLIPLNMSSLGMGLEAPRSMKGSDLLVRCLENEEVEFVFQVPGEETLAITDSLGQSKKIKLITVRHEQAAAFMAGVYGRLTGRPGMWGATPGPGATKLSTGIADGKIDTEPPLP